MLSNPVFYKNLSLKPYNSFRFDVSASRVVFVDRIEQLTKILGILDFNTLPPIVLGGGSNVLLKSNIDGLVIVMKTNGVRIIQRTKTHTFIQVESGFGWDQFVKYALSQKLYGLENLSLIPGTVGASPIQNIGAYGVEIKDFLYELDAIKIVNNKKETFTNYDCKFGYRDSVFKNELKDKYIISSVTFKLSNTPQINLSDRKLLESIGDQYRQITPEILRKHVIKIRSARLPDIEKVGNAGSFYLNSIVSKETFNQIHANYPDVIFYPIDNGSIKISAGWMIERCGFRGFKNLCKGVGVYDKNPLVLVNYGTGSGNNIIELSNQIIESVRDKFDINLVIEPTIYGNAQFLGEDKASFDETNYNRACR